MSGDLGPRVVIDACKIILDRLPNLRLTLVGDDALPALMHSLPADRVSYQFATQVVSMTDTPSQALRHKKDSSMHKTVTLVRDGVVDACVSAGNTGALLLVATHYLGCLQGIERAAIARVLPTRGPLTVMLDLGAVTQATPAQLLQFALMGCQWASASGVISPTLALLNIGTESHKGTDVLQAAQVLLRDAYGTDYHGFIEANHMLDGSVNVIVTDGFSGNVALKASEGTARFIGDKIRSVYGCSWWARLLGLISYPVLRNLKRELDPSRYNGAIFLGLQQVVVKSHGNADAEGVAAAIALAYEQSRAGVPVMIAGALAPVSASLPFTHNEK